MPLSTTIENTSRDALQTKTQRGYEIRCHYLSGDVSPGLPHCNHCRQTRQTSPFAHHVINVKRLHAGDSESSRLANDLAFGARPAFPFDSHGDSQSRIAN